MNAPCEGFSIWISRFGRHKLKTWYLWDFVKGQLKIMIIFRWQAHDSRVKIGVSPHIWFSMFSFGVIWTCAFRFNETLIVDIRTSKKTWNTYIYIYYYFYFNLFFWSLCNVNNLRTPSFSLNATSCRSKSSNSACFHTWRSPHIWVRPFEPHWTHSWLHFLLKALRSPLFQVAQSDPVVGFPPPCNVKTCQQRGQRSSTCVPQVHMDVA